MIHHLMGFERFLGIAPIGDPKKFLMEGVRNGPILRPRPSLRLSSSAVDVIFHMADIKMVGWNVGSSGASLSDTPAMFDIID